jgi:hypothetical protein
MPVLFKPGWVSVTGEEPVHQVVELSNTTGKSIRVKLHRPLHPCLNFLLPEELFFLAAGISLAIPIEVLPGAAKGPVEVRLTAEVQGAGSVALPISVKVDLPVQYCREVDLGLLQFSEKVTRRLQFRNRGTAPRTLKLASSD